MIRPSAASSVTPGRRDWDSAMSVRGRSQVRKSSPAPSATAPQIVTSTAQRSQRQGGRLGGVGLGRRGAARGMAACSTTARAGFFAPRLRNGGAVRPRGDTRTPLPAFMR